MEYKPASILDLDRITLGKGNHPTRDTGVCALEAAAWLAGEPHSDHPLCVCPAISDFLRSWNDNLPSNAERDRLIKPLLPVIIRTARDKNSEIKRRWMVYDWMV